MQAAEAAAAELRAAVDELHRIEEVSCAMGYDFNQ
jgi:hypothetical protein